MPRPAVPLARLIPRPEPAAPDAQLLRAFAAAGSDDAFAELVRRHGPVVLAACRRLLGNHADAEDAFQATFLVLARKAGTVRDNLGGWLYAVAVRIARGVRVMRDRRRKHEAQASPGRQPGDGSPDPDLAAVIDEELARLPDHLRAAVVLCELRGLARKEAAAELGVPEGTLSSRLAAARRRLADRLSARGLSAPAVLAAALAPAAVSAGLVRSAVAAVRGAATPAAGAAASVVVKAMLLDQLKAVALAAGVLLTAVCGGWAMTGNPGEPPAPANTPAPRAADDAARLVGQLGSDDFAAREAAGKKLRELGSAAEPALRAGLRSESPEVRERCAKLITAIRTDAREALARGFDPAKESQPDHSVWDRFKRIAGDTRASRDLFARVIKNADWLRRLDAAGDGPEAAARQYHEACVEVGKRYQGCMKVLFQIFVWPCDPAEEAAYLLFLGSHAGTASARPAGQDRDFEPFVAGEGRIHYARGLDLGLAGKEIAPGPKKDYQADAPLTPGSDRVFARLLAAWLDHRDRTSDVVPPSLWLAAKHDAKELLPLARTIAAEKFPTDRLPPPALFPAALAVLARMGTADDLPLFARWFADTMVAGELESSVPPGAKPPPPVITQVGDAALALALLLFDRDPAEFGFGQAAKRFVRTGGRPTVGQYDHYQLHNFGFTADKDRTAAHAKAKAFLDKQKPVPKMADPEPVPPLAKLVEQLGDPEFATREAAEKELRRIGLAAEAALKAGLASESPEVRERAAKLLPAVRKDALDALAKDFDPAGTGEPDHPVWKRFRATVGGDSSARHLFAEIARDPRRLQLLDAADRDPGKAGELYEREVRRIADDTEKGVTRQGDPAAGKIPGGAFLRGNVFDPDDSMPKPADVAAAFYLGTYPATAKALEDANWERSAPLCGVEVGLFTQPFQVGLDTPNYPTHPEPVTVAAFRRTFAAWLARRACPGAIVLGLDQARAHRVPDVLPTARAVAADPKMPTRVRAAAVPILGAFGRDADEPLVAALLDETTEVARCPYGIEQKVAAVQVRDAALGTLLARRGKNPGDFGFPGMERHGSADLRVQPLYPHYLGFYDDATRAAAHAKARKWLAEPKPEGQLLRLDGHTGLVGGVAFFPEGDRLVTSGYDATYRVWDAKTGRQLDERSTGTKESQVGGPCAVSPDGKRVAARYFVADADTGKFLFGLEGHTGKIARIAYSADGKRIVTASHDGTVRVWTAGGKELKRFDAHMGTKVDVTSGGPRPREPRYVNRGASDAAFSPDGTRVVSGGVDGTVRVWDVETAKELRAIKLDRTMVMAVAFLPDGKWVVSGGSDGIIRAWDAATGEELAKFEGHTGIIAALAVTADGKRVVSAGHDKTVRVWDVETAKELRCFRGHTAAVQAVAVSPDGQTVLSGAEDNTARLWAVPKP